MDVDQLVSSIGLDRDHQMRAVKAALQSFLVHGRRGVVLADEVGCGKTYEALAIAALLWRRFKDTSTPVQRILVVAEHALMPKWFDEIEAPPSKEKGSQRGFQQYVASTEWDGFRTILRNVTQLEGRRDGEGRGVREGGKLQVPPGRIYLVKPLLMTGGGAGEASPMVRWLRKTDWDIVIVDEAHHFTNLKNERGRVFFPDYTPDSRAQGLVGRFILALTATPFQLAVKEIVHLLRVVLAPEGDLELLRDGLARYEGALEHFYARRRLAPSDEGRRRCVERLHELRVANASGGDKPETPGLEELLRRYLIRNVKTSSERDYEITERSETGYAGRPFEKLADLRPVVRESPLIPLEGDDAWVYLQLRDVLVDAHHASLAEEVEGQAREKPSFIAGDLRQCLSSYEQLQASAILAKQLPRAEQTMSLVRRLVADRHPHPKVAALCAVVDDILRGEIERVRERPQAGFQKILVFNSYMHTAHALRDALMRTVEERIDPFVEEQLRAAGWSGIVEAREMVRAALREEREVAREQLGQRFDARFLSVTPELLDGTGLEMRVESRQLVDVMFHRAEEHCAQHLFLLRMALWLRNCGEPAEPFAVQMFLMRHVGDRLKRSLEAIVGSYLAVESSDENEARARRELGRLGRVLARPDYVARFDGETVRDRERSRENFNRPYAPLVLLASRVGEEGIDLQQHTRFVLHYDVEWNPAKMEQREGRVDREGRRTQGPVKVHFFLLKDTYEERIFHTVMQRDAWFQVLIGSKRQELAKGSDDDPEEVRDAEVEEDLGRLTLEERKKVMIDLRP